MEAIHALSAAKDYAAKSRLGVSAADTDTDMAAFYSKAGINPVNLSAAGTVQITAACTVTGQTLQASIILYDAKGLPLAVAALPNIVSTGLTSSGKYLSNPVTVSVGTAYNAAILLSSVGGGVWDITLQAA